MQLGNDIPEVVWEEYEGLAIDTLALFPYLVYVSSILKLPHAVHLHKKPLSRTRESN